MAKTPVIDIRPADLETVREILQRHVPGHEVLAFGSRVRWTARDYSDLDLAIRSDEPIPSKIISEIKEELSESNLPMRVDVLDMASVDEKFRRIIEEEYAVVQESSFVHALNECAVLVRDNVHPKDAAGMPYIGLEHIEAETLHLKGNGLAEDVTSAKLKFKKGDILFGKLRPYFRKVIRAPFDGVCSADIWVVRAKPGVAQDYVFYWMASDDFVNFTNSGSEGTRMPRAKWEYAAKHEQKKVSLEKQRKIAHILATLDDKIELNRRMNKTLEVMAQAIFKSWFVDFDPVHAKAEGRDTGLPPKIDGLFPDEFEESELGNIPRGWEVKPLDAIAEFLNGLALQKFPPKVGEADLPVIKITELRNGVTARSDRASANIPDQYIVEDGDVLFSWSGSLLQRIWTGGPSALNQHLFKVSSSQYPKWFYYFWVNRHLADFQAIAAGKATTMGHIQRHHLREAQTTVPDARLLKAADAHMAPLFAKIVTTARTDCALVTLRDTLLPNLLSRKVSGELN